MQFSTLFITAFATLASATAVEKRQDIPGLNCGGLDLLKCAAALSPAIISCIAAAVQAEIDPITDAACFAEAGNDLANLPESCQNCF